MKYIFVVLVICSIWSIESSSIKSFLNTKNSNKLKFTLDDLTNEDTSPYAYLEGKTDSSLDQSRTDTIIEEPRFLSVKQTPAPSAAISTIPSNPSTTTTPVIVASSPPGMQLTRLPYVAPADPLTNSEISLESDPEMAKLGAALEAVKEDIVGNSKQISDEKKWVGAVKAITQSYEDKMKRVQDHITALRKEQKQLFDKKKQIENLKLQKRLQSKLSAASEELKTLQNSLDHVQQKSHELNSEHANLQTTIQKIESQLTKLKGAESSQKGKHKDDGDDGEVKDRSHDGSSKSSEF